MIVIMDNHGQYVHRIWRTLRYLGVEAKIIPNTTPLDEIKALKPKGLSSQVGQIWKELETARLS
jgi:GMP synthase (glutamine-hydrolysing)